MNFEQFKGNSIVCFSKEELERLLKDYMFQLMRNKIDELGLSVEELEKDLKDLKMDNYQKIANSAGGDVANGKLHEVFAALHIYLPFFEATSEICFELKSNFIHGKSSISCIEDLERFRADVFGDFIIKSADGYRIFQLKRYRGDLTSSALFTFLKTKIDEYGRSFGDTNLLLILQCSNRELDFRIFREVHEELKKQNIELTGEVLVSFNEEETETVIVEVYPVLRKTSVPRRK